MKGLTTFIFGALVGAALAALYTPVTGEELRNRIRRKLRELGVIKVDDVEELVEMIAASIEKDEKA